jgi:hypothetical protein
MPSTGMLAGQVDGRQLGVPFDHVARQPLFPPRVEPGQEVGRQGRVDHGFAGDTGAVTGVAQGSETVQNLLGDPGDPRHVVAFRQRRPGGDGQTFEHLHEQSRQGQTRPIRVRGDMEQDDAALPQSRPRDERRTVGQRRDGAVRKLWIGLRHDLALDGDVVGDRQAEKRRCFGEGTERLGLTPGHGATDRAPPGPEPHGHQRTGGVARHIGCRKPGAGEPHQKPAALYPVDQRGFLVRRYGRHVGQNQGVGTGQQHVRQRALHQVGGGRERLPKVVQGRQKRLALILALGVDQGDLPALQRIVCQRDRARRPLAGDLEARDAVAKFRGQVELRRSGRLTRVQQDRLPRQVARDARRVQPVRHHGQLPGREGEVPLHIRPDHAVRELRRQHGQHVATALKDRDGTKCRKGRQQVIATGMGKPVGHPENLGLQIESRRPIRRRPRSPGRRGLGQWTACVQTTRTRIARTVHQPEGPSAPQWTPDARPGWPRRAGHQSVPSGCPSRAPRPMRRP